MILHVDCESCGQTLRAREEWAGRAARCPRCESWITIPADIEELEEAEILELVPVEESTSESANWYGNDFDAHRERTRATHSETPPPKPFIPEQQCPMCGRLSKVTANECASCGEELEGRSLPVTSYREHADFTDHEDRQYKKFCAETRALCSFWVFMSALTITTAFLLVSIGEVARMRAGAGLFFGFLLFLGSIWLVLGIMTGMRSLWAIYGGLSVSYVVMVQLALAWYFLDPVSLVRFLFLTEIILLLIIIQAHITIRRGSTLESAGVDLAGE